MTHPIPITVFDYMSALARTIRRPIHPSRLCDGLLPGGCERCHATITSHDAYFAAFGTVRCRTCIGNDGFATVADLELFRRTATLPCSGCGLPVQPAEVSPDGSFYTYHCPTCGSTAHFSTATVA